MGGGEFRVFLLCHLEAKISHCGLSCISLRLVILSIFSCTVVLSLKFHFWVSIAAAAAKSLQSCLILCDSIDGSPPGSTVPGILQARTLEWVAISFSNAWKWKVKLKSLSHVWLFTTPWTAAYQAPLPMGYSRQEYWSGLPLPSPSNTIIFFFLFNIDLTSCGVREESWESLGLQGDKTSQS